MDVSQAYSRSPDGYYSIHKAGNKFYRLRDNFTAKLKQEGEISERNVNRSDNGGQRFLQFLLFY